VIFITSHDGCEGGYGKVIAVLRKPFDSAHLLAALILAFP
jgi:hypothetical protein